MNERVYDMAGEPKPEWTTVCDMRPNPKTRVLARCWRYPDGRAGYYVDVYRDGELSSMSAFKSLREVRERCAEEGVHL